MERLIALLMRSETLAAVLGFLAVLFFAQLAKAGECITWEKGLSNLAKQDSDYVGVKLTEAQTAELHTAKGVKPIPGWSYGYIVNLTANPMKAVVFVFGGDGCALDYTGVSTPKVLEDLALIADKPEFTKVAKGPAI
jgi:hypothetical protein